jgi:catechol 2,3-dioxygenase-like lactoylglutathione lyase family enzyme
MITGLDHANIYTARLDETIAFFTDIIGLKNGPRPDVPIPGAWLYSGDKPIVHLVGHAEARTAKGVIDHFALAVSDLEPVLQRLEARGVAYNVIDIPGGFGRQAFVTDPNGVTVELTQRVTPSA